MRKIIYAKAINEAIMQMMEKDKSVFLLGQGCKSPWYVGRTCDGLIEKFGEERVIDTPVSENAMTGAAVGAAIAGMKPIVVHPRVDFMMYAIDPIVNEAANWHYITGGKISVPVVIWGIINRGGEQGAQHSQALQALFAHIPGLKVVMPSCAYDAKGLMVAAIKEKNPIVYIDDRWLYADEGEVPEEIYEVPIGKGIIRKEGKDITVVAISYMQKEVLKAAEELEKEGINIEVVDPRTVSPFDVDLVASSVEKTGHLLVVEGSWLTGCISNDISSHIANKFFGKLKAPIERICLPDCPAPTSSVLEKEFYIDYREIISTVKKILGK